MQARDKRDEFLLLAASERIGFWTVLWKNNTVRKLGVKGWDG